MKSFFLDEVSLRIKWLEYSRDPTEMFQLNSIAFVSNFKKLFFLKLNALEIFNALDVYFSVF